MKFQNILIAAVSTIVPLVTILPTLTLPATAQQSTQQTIRSGECSARVVGDEPGSRVNMRSGPGTDFEISNYVLVGQVVNELIVVGEGRIRRQDNRGSTWQLVEYTPSSTRGWIRTDFLRQVGCGS